MPPNLRDPLCTLLHAKNAMRAGAIVVSVLAWAVSATAGNVGNRSEFQAFMDLATGAGKHTVSFAGSGNPLVTTGVPGSSAVGNMNFSHAAGGWPVAGGTATLPSPVAGKSVPLAVKQPLTKAATAAALGRFASRAVPIASTGMAIYLLMQELGFTASDTNGDGIAEWNKPLASTCYTAPCYEWNVAWTSGALLAWKPTRDLAAGQTVGLTIPAGFTGGGTGNVVQLVFVNNTDSNWFYGWNASVPFYNASWWSGQKIFYSRTRTPDAPGSGTTALTEQQVIDAIASASGWPSNSNVDAALAQAVNAGYPVESEGAPTLTPSATKVTSDPKVTTRSDGSSQSETMTCDLVVPFGLGTTEWVCSTTTTTSNPTKQTSSTVTTTNPDGTTTTQTVTTTTPGGTTSATVTGPTETQQTACGLPTTPPCKIDETGTPGAPVLDGTKSAEDALKAQNDFATSPVSKLPTHPTLNFAFVLPSGCAPVSIAAFAPWLSSIDLCPFVSMFHGVMSVVWVMGGLFGAISMFWRSALSPV